LHGDELNLEATGEYEVVTAYSGEEGLTKAKEVDFDLLITDCKMPGIDGKEVLNDLKEIKPHSPVVIFSIYHNDNSTVTSEIKNKADGIISKPIDHEQFHKIIRDVLASSKS